MGLQDTFYCHASCFCADFSGADSYTKAIQAEICQSIKETIAPIRQTLFNAILASQSTFLASQPTLLASQPNEARNSLLWRAFSNIPESTQVQLALRESAEDQAQFQAHDQRLEQRAAQYGFHLKAVAKDGNCQFAALADQLNIIKAKSHHAKSVRQDIVQWLRDNKDIQLPNETTLAGFVEGDFIEFCDEMTKPGTWGNHITLQAACEVYGVAIHVISSAEVPDPQWYYVIAPFGSESTDLLHLAHWVEWHYGSLVRFTEYAGQPRIIHANSRGSYHSAESDCDFYDQSPEESGSMKRPSTPPQPQRSSKRRRTKEGT